MANIINLSDIKPEDILDDKDSIDLSSIKPEDVVETPQPEQESGPTLFGRKVFPTKESLAGSMKTLGDVKAAVEAGLYKTTAIPEVVGGAIQATVGPEMATASGPGLDSAWMQRYQANKGAIEQFLNEQQARSPIIGGAAEMAASLAAPTPKIKAVKAVVEKLPMVGKVMAPVAERVAGITALGAGEAALKGENVEEAAESTAKTAAGFEAFMGGLKGAGKLGKGAVGLYSRMRGFSPEEINLFRADPQSLLKTNMADLVNYYSDEALALGNEAKKLAAEGAEVGRVVDAQQAFANKIKQEQSEAMKALESSQAAARETEASDKAMRTLQASEAASSKKSKIAELKSQASDLMKKAEEEAKQPYLSAKSRKVTESEGQVLKDTFDKANKQIRSLGEEQGRILDESGISFNPSEIEQAMNPILDKYAVKAGGEAIQDADYRAISKFKMYLKPFQDKGIDIPSKELVRIRQKIDDAAYGKAGKEQEFSDVPEAALREMRTVINSMIDSKVPEYAAKRPELAEAYKIHDDLVNTFGTSIGEFAKKLSRVEGKYSQPMLDILDRAGKKFGTDIGEIARSYAKEKGLTAADAKKLVEETQSYQKLIGGATEASTQAERLGGELEVGQRARAFAEQTKTAELSRARRLEKEALEAKGKSEFKAASEELNKAKDKQKFIESQRNEIVSKAAERGYSEAAIGDLATAQKDIEPLLRAGFIDAQPSVATVTEMNQLVQKDPRIMREIKQLGVNLKLAKKEKYEATLMGVTSAIIKSLLPVKGLLKLEDKLGTALGKNLTPEERAWLHKAVVTSMDETED